MLTERAVSFVALGGTDGGTDGGAAALTTLT
jgi:hypothetical protein